MNKLILTDISHHGAYLDAANAYFAANPRARMKETPRLGWEAITVALPNQKPDFDFLRQQFGA